MAILARIDVCLYDRIVEPITHRVEYEFGITNYHLARFLLLLCPAAFAAYTIHLTVNDPLFKLNLFITVAHTLLSVGLYGISLRHERLFTRANPMRYSPGPIRTRIGLLSLTLVHILLTSLADMRNIALFGLTLSFYLLGCNRMPPGYKKEERQSKLAPQST